MHTRATTLNSPGKPTLYIAYGSNLDLAGMAARCPGAYADRAMVLQGWSLRLPLLGDIEPDWSPDARVHCALYRVSEADVTALDRFEDAAPWGSGLYERVSLRLEATGEIAFAYVLSDAARRDPSALRLWCERHFGSEAGIEAARSNYVRAIARGYEDWGFPLERLLAAEHAGGDHIFV
jgi:gamma-glutamylcyclotransferase (GGCT)/AIG2-like uncharacterized protein YtfP